MATRRRDALPGKKAPSSPQTTPAAKLKSAVNKITTKTSIPTSPRTKPISKPPTTPNLSKPQIKKPSSLSTPTKPTQPRIKPLDTKKPPTPATKPRATTRSSPLSSKPAASPKLTTSKTFKQEAKNEVKRRVSMPARRISSSSIGLKKKEKGTKASEAKEQEESKALDKGEDPKEEEIKDIQDSYLEEKEADQEPLISLADPTVVIDQSSPLDVNRESEHDEVEKGKEVGVAEEKQEDEASKAEKKKEGSSPPERMHGKIDVAVSNDVIEETAMKLQEQRKNRVRALARAFETVISLQEK